MMSRLKRCLIAIGGACVVAIALCIWGARTANAVEPTAMATGTAEATLTSTRAFSPTPETTATRTPAPTPGPLFLPILARHWPPLPYPPVLKPIDNSSFNRFYSIVWEASYLSEYYRLEEDDGLTFGSPAVKYAGTDKSLFVSGQPASTWYYRVQGCNTVGCGGWSEVRAVTVLPPTPTPIPVAVVYIDNRTGGNLCYEVRGSGIGRKCSSDGDWLYGTFPPGTYTWKASARCGSISGERGFNSTYTHQFWCSQAAANVAQANGSKADATARLGLSAELMAASSNQQGTQGSVFLPQVWNGNHQSDFPPAATAAPTAPPSPSPSATPTLVPTSTATETASSTPRPTGTRTHTPLPPTPGRRFDTSLYVDGSSFAAAADSKDLDVGDEEGEDVVLEAWVKFTGTTFRQGAIVAKDRAYGLFTQKSSVVTPVGLVEIRCLVMAVDSGSVQKIARYCGDNQPGSESFEFGELDEWTHVVGQLTRRSGEIELFTNGYRRQSEAEGSGVTTLNNSSSPLIVGMGITAQIEQVRVSSKLRYVPRYSYPSYPLGCDEHTRGLWEFDDPPDTRVFHESGCGEDRDDLVSIGGAALWSTPTPTSSPTPSPTRTRAPTPVPVDGEWTKITSPSDEALMSVAMSSANVGWAVGVASSGHASTLLKWDGTSWTHQDPSTRLANDIYSDHRSISMVSGTDGWIVGDDFYIENANIWFVPKMMRWDGNRWTAIPRYSSMFSGEFFNQLSHVVMVSSAEGWALGSTYLTWNSNSNSILHWNGSRWIASASPIQKDLRSIDLVGAAEGWTVGDEGTILRLIRGKWYGVNSPTRADLQSVSMIAANDGWAVGSDGTIVRWDGSKWTIAPSPTTVDLVCVAMVTGSDGWAIGKAGVLLRWDGSQWTVYSSTVTQGLTAASMSMVSSTDGWLVGSGGTILHWNGVEWNKVPSPTAKNLAAVNALSSDDAWAVGPNELILHWDGTVWTVVENPPAGTMYEVATMNPDNGWAVGVEGQIIRWDGTKWTPVKSPTTATLRSIESVAPSDGWAVGVSGTILHYDGVEWVQQSSPITNSLFSITMVTADEGWAVGTGGIIIRWNGSRWQVVASPTRENLLSVAMLTADDGWAVGAKGTILRWNGSQWSLAVSPTQVDLNSLAMVTATDGWAVGDDATILHWDGTAWGTVRTLPYSFDLHSVVMPTADQGWAVGQSGAILRYLPRKVKRAWDADGWGVPRWRITDREGVAAAQ